MTIRDERAERLATALRDNLRKRKARDRAADDAVSAIPAIPAEPADGDAAAAPPRGPAVVRDAD